MSDQSSANPAYSQKATDENWEPFEVGVVQWLRKDDDVQSGIWACKASEQPGIHEAEFEGDETILVLEGKVRIEIVDGPTVEVGAGDSASFVKGTTGRWKVLEDVKQFFVYS